MAVIQNSPRLPKAEVLKYFSSTIILVLVALLFLLITFLITVRVERVGGSEIGVMINNLTGEISVMPESGTKIYNGLFNSFHILDKTQQRLEMTQATNRGDRKGRDDLRIKTTDGNDVFLNLTINYKIQPHQIEDVVLKSGLGEAYKTKWVRDYARSICRTVFGEMTTEQFYDTSLRNAKETEAKIELNELLAPFGLEVTTVASEGFSFHEEYEDKIREKKLADQEVEEQISKAKAALQDQIFRTVTATKAKETAIAEYEGDMRKLVVAATAEAEKSVLSGEAYSIETKLGADAEFYEKDKNSQAILAEMQAEAEGMAKMAAALEGQGGHSIVKLEYANRIKDMTFSGQPYTISGKTERFSHTEEGSAAKRRPAMPAPPAAATP